MSETSKPDEPKQPERDPEREAHADRIAQAIVDNLKRNVAAEYEQDVAEYHAIKARGETPPKWLAHIVEDRRGKRKRARNVPGPLS